MQHGQRGGRETHYVNNSIHLIITSVTILMETVHAITQRKISYLKIFQFKAEKLMHKSRLFFT
jgi:hypothetical protein